MSETVAERRERLVRAVGDGLNTLVGPLQAEAALDALLDALEPPVAEMVRRGCASAYIGEALPDASLIGQKGRPLSYGERMWYRPAP